MPSPENMQDARPVLGHVNLMVDTLIANATLNDLQAFVRTTLATSCPAVAGTFTAAARRHLAKTNAGALPDTGTLFATADGRRAQPTRELFAVLARSRMLYGAGMGLAGLAVLTQVVRATVGMQWAIDSETEDVLAAVDADMTQAIQSAKEEIDGGRVGDVAAAKEAHGALLKALKDEKQDVEGWGGDFPFERALSSVELWKV